MTIIPLRNIVELILFLSKTLTPIEQRYQLIELEVAYIVQTIKTIRQIIKISTYKVTIITDYASIVGIIRQTALTSSATDKLNIRLTRASLYVLQFKNLKICYVPGREYIVLDVLSRLPAYRGYEKAYSEDVLDDLVIAFLLKTVLDSYVVTTTLNISADFRKALRYGYGTDQFIADVGKIVRNQLDSESFYQEDGLLQYKIRLYIPDSLKGNVFSTAYNS